MSRVFDKIVPPSALQWGRLTRRFQAPPGFAWYAIPVTRKATASERRAQPGLVLTVSSWEYELRPFPPRPPRSEQTR